MSKHEIPEAAVEAAARLIAKEVWRTPHTGDISPEHLARLTLEAAAPHMLDNGWARAYAAGFQAAKDGRNYDAIGSNPYRSQP